MGDIGLGEEPQWFKTIREGKMEERKFWAVLWGIIAATTVIISCAAMYWGYASDRLYVENGYERVMLVGEKYPQWQKVK